MKTSRHAVMATASLMALSAAIPAVVRADDQRSPPGNEEGQKNPHGKDRQGGRDERGGPPQGQPGQPGGKPRGEGRRDDQRRNNPSFGQQQQQQRQQQPGFQQKKFGNGDQGGNPNAFGKPKPPVMNRTAEPPPPPPQQQQPVQHPPKQNAGQQNFNNSFGNQNNERNKDQFRKPTDKRDWKHGPPPGNAAGAPGAPPGSPPGWHPGTLSAPPGTPPAPVGNPGQFNKPFTPNMASQPRQPLSAADAKRRFETLRGQRKEVKIDNGRGVVIEEPGARRIFKDNNRVMITHDDNERLRRVAPNARFERGSGGTNIAVIDRPGGYKIYSETDANGQLIRRYRRGPDGRDFIIIDNRRRRHDNFGRDVAAGIGIGVGVVAGAAILNSMLDVPPPRISIPRDEYIVDYERANDEDVYEALSAPPVEDFRDRYTLDEIRATATLRDRMRRVDLDDITFEFGAWDVNPSEYGKLERIARAMRRIIERNPNEVFMIEGYTDAVGSQEDNLSLSDRRAESVAEVLTDQFQIPFENLTTQGYGEEYLKVPTQAPERLNRRVAVRRITPLLARGNGSQPPQGGAPQRSYDGPPRGGPDDGGADDGQDGGPDDGGPPPSERDDRN